MKNSGLKQIVLVQQKHIAILKHWNMLILGKIHKQGWDWEESKRMIGDRIE